MRLLFRRYSNLLSGNATWKLFSRSKPAWRTGFNNARIGVTQTQTLAHVVQPPTPPLPQSIPFAGGSISVDRVQAVLAQFNDLFRDSPPDLAERLMSTILSNPGSDCAMALSGSLFCAESESLDASIRAVVQVLPRTTDIVVNTDEPVTFRDTFKMFISYFLWIELSLFGSEQATEIICQRVLHAALFSASAVKNGLLDKDFIYIFTTFGLRLSVSKPPKDDRKMVAAMRAAACLQLVTAGNIFMEKLSAKSGGLVDTKAVLEWLRSERSIAHPRGLERLLEKTIEMAESNFANPLSASDAWKILYPTDNYHGAFGRGDE